ncbi:hypothetical protein CP966_24725 [Streptomyces galilaeus]|nr:hypothetical protein CP966_24725 [Streptomyces galilaeus]
MDVRHRLQELRPHIPVLGTAHKLSYLHLVLVNVFEHVRVCGSAFLTKPVLVLISRLSCCVF